MFIKLKALSHGLKLIIRNSQHHSIDIRQTFHSAAITTIQYDGLNGVLKIDDNINNPVPVGLKSRCPEPQDPDLPGLLPSFLKTHQT